MPPTLLNWNDWLAASENESNGLVPGLQNALVVAYDVVGGFFVVNGGAFDGEQGSIYYLAPDSLEWEALNLSYSGLLNWACDGDLASFYGDMRWQGWEREVAQLDGGTGISIYPPLWANRETPVSERPRRPVPACELWGMELELMEQLRGQRD
jgi:hypothetical protein